MKKIVYMTMICLMISVFCSTATSNAKTTEFDIEFALIPYNKVLTKLTEEFGVDIYVPEENKEKFYNNVKNLTPKQFEKKVRQQYEEARQYISQSSYSESVVKEGNILHALPIPNATQTPSAIPIN